MCMGQRRVLDEVVSPHAEAVVHRVPALVEHRVALSDYPAARMPLLACSSLLLPWCSLSNTRNLASFLAMADCCLIS
jgi:hypothetical protein